MLSLGTNGGDKNEVFYLKNILSLISWLEIKNKTMIVNGNKPKEDGNSQNY